MTTELKGRTALITGGNRGLGKSIAEALGRAGASLALVARDQAKLDETVNDLRSQGAQAEGFAADVTDEAQVQKAYDAIAQKLGVVSILVNNAGINIRKPMHEYDLAEWNSVIQTNLTSAFIVSKACIPAMKENGYGRIINLSSMMAHISLPARTAYSASKAGILGMTKSLALELAPHKITVVAISPGPFATEMNLPVLNNPELNAQFVSKIPLGAWGDVKDIGELTRFLCSDAGKFITGTDIIIDGGWTAQ